MRKHLMVAALIFGVVLISFGQTDYKMLQLVYLKPIPGANLEEASKAIAAHNKKYHAEEPYKASLWTNNTGSMVGTWTWAMWPATFTDYDSRPEGKDHDKDWDEATSKYFTLVTNEYWREDSKLSYSPENSESGDKVLFAVYDIAPGDSYRFKAILEQVMQVFKEKKYDRNFTVYWNRFDNKDGRDVAIETMFDNWSFFDEDRNMKKDFEEVHGEGTWWKLMEEFKDVVISVDDELSIRVTDSDEK